MTNIHYKIDNGEIVGIGNFYTPLASEATAIINPIPADIEQAFYDDYTQFHIFNGALAMGKHSNEPDKIATDLMTLANEILGLEISVAYPAVQRVIAEEGIETRIRVGKWMNSRWHAAKNIYESNDYPHVFRAAAIASLGSVPSELMMITDPLKQFIALANILKDVTANPPGAMLFITTAGVPTDFVNAVQYGNIGTGIPYDTSSWVLGSEPVASPK